MSASRALPTAPASPNASDAGSHAAERSPPTKRLGSGRTRAALVAAGVVAVASGLLVWRIGQMTALADVGQHRFVAERPIEPITAADILADLAAFRAATHGASALPTAQRQSEGPTRMAASPPSAPPAARPALPAQRPGRGARRPGAPGPATRPPDPIATDPYATLFGAPEQFRAGNALTAAQTRDAPLEVPRAGGGEGTLLPARLSTEVASVPTGGPVIALLQRPIRLLGTTWPKGTEVHGTCQGSGNSDTRVFVQFEALRLRSGRMQQLRGVAVDLQGRHGIAGKKQLTRRTAGSVGLSAATSAASALGQTLAGRFGAVVGSGIDGAAQAGQEKAGRLDQDEYVVTVERGALLQIYVQQIEAP